MNETPQVMESAAAGGKNRVIHTLMGKVTSNKMVKTITVTVERLIKDERYGKFIRRSTKIHAHDADSTCRVGDVVEITQCRRLAKTKAWTLVRIVERAPEV